MKLAHRLWLAAALPFVALALISFQYYRQTVDTGLNLALHQQAGLPLLKDLRALLELLEEQRSASILVAIEEAPDKTALNAADARLEQISAHVQNLSAAMVAASLTSSEASWRPRRAMITDILDRLRRHEPVSFDKFSEAAEGIIAQIDAVGQESEFAAGFDRSVSVNLLLTDLLPQLAEEVSILRSLTAYTLHIDELTPADASRISRYLGLSRYRSIRVMARAGTVADAGSPLATDITALTSSLDTRFKTFDGNIQNYLSHGVKVPTKDLLDLGLATKKNIYALFDRLFQDITTVIAADVARHKRDLLLALGMTAASIGLCVIILFLVIRSSARSVRALVDITQKIAGGERSIELEIPPGSAEFAALGASVGTMYQAIRHTEANMRDEAERRQFLADLSSNLESKTTPATLGDTYLQALVSRFKAVMGGVYVRDESPGQAATLTMVSGFAQEAAGGTTSKAAGSVLTAALKADAPILIDNLNDKNSRSVQTGMLKILPETVMVAPVHFESETLGVIELGFLTRPTAAALSLIEQSLSAFGVRLKSEVGRATLERLYDKTKVQAEELEERQREMELINTDLEQKTQELEQQQVELEIINQKLEEQRHAIEEKHADVAKMSKYKSEFLANMSHELRSPLNSILIFSEILAKNDNKTYLDKEVEFAKTINSAGKDLLNLIEDILDLSKVEAGHLEIRPETFILSDVVRTLEHSFGMQIEKKGLRLNIDVGADVPTSWHTDRQRVTQIIRNFMANALKFTDQGSITLKIGRPKVVKPTSGVQPDNAVEIQVIDTGIGIEKKDQDKLFVPFKQIDSGANRKFAGTGLGLSISSNLAALLGGYVGVESKPGEGSTFTAVLPFELRGTAIKPPQESAPHNPVQWEDDRDGLLMTDKVMLIIEDDVQFANYLVDSCHKRGFKCVVAPNGEDGLKQAVAIRPRGIILDIKLPGMSGISVLEQLRNEPRTQRVPVHVISAYEYRIEAERHDNVSFLRKPVSRDNLDALLDSIDRGLEARNVLLIAPDNDETKDLMTSFERRSIVALQVKNGETATPFLDRESFGCIVINLSGEQGLNVLQQIRKHPQCGKVPVIFITDDKMTQAHEREVAMHAGSIIVKGEKAKERLLDEVILFLHSVDARSPGEKSRQPVTHNQDGALRGKKILLVDDDMRNLFAILSVLEADGAHVTTATNGREALERLNVNPDVDIVLMDMMMPEMDGYEAMRQIRKNERFKELPIIALTARAMKGEKEQCLAAGANDYMSKPLKIDQLLTLLKMWVA